MNTYYVLCFSVALLVAYANAEPSRCYFCDDYSTCNSPIDVSQVPTKSCGSGNFMKNPLALDSSLSQSFYSSSKTQPEDSEALAVSQACIKISGKIAGKTETWRDCHDKTIRGVEFCTFAKAVLPDWTDLTCSTCDTDLCNDD